MPVPEFHNIEVVLTDINQHNLDMVASLCQRDLDENGVPIKIHATLNRREALTNARYIINCVRIGMLEAFETDIEIPLKYGVDQCVGDTLCAGGIMYGQRGIAAILDFCKDIREVSEPGAIMLNYSNPNAMMTWNKQIRRCTYNWSLSWSSGWSSSNCRSFRPEPKDVKIREELIIRHGIFL